MHSKEFFAQAAKIRTQFFFSASKINRPLIGRDTALCDKVAEPTGKLRRHTLRYSNNFCVLRTLRLPDNLNILAPEVLSFLERYPIANLEFIMPPPDLDTLVVDCQDAMLEGSLRDVAPPGGDAFGRQGACMVEMSRCLDTSAGGDLYSDLA